MSNRDHLTPKSTVDRNGRQTTVYVNETPAAPHPGRSVPATPPRVAAGAIEQRSGTHTIFGTDRDTLKQLVEYDARAQAEIPLMDRKTEVRGAFHVDGRPVWVIDGVPNSDAPDGPRRTVVVVGQDPHGPYSVADSAYLPVSTPRGEVPTYTSPTGVERPLTEVLTFEQAQQDDPGIDYIDDFDGDDTYGPSEAVARLYSEKEYLFRPVLSGIKMSGKPQPYHRAADPNRNLFDR